MQQISYSEGSVTQYAGGADGCGSCPAVSPTPGQWPGQSAAESHEAFPASGPLPAGRQPLNLQCWPKNSAFDLMPCGSAVLEDTASVERPWTGHCNNLEVTAAATQVDCAAACVNDQFCSVWMWANNMEDPPAPACYSGVGTDCWTTADRLAVTVVASQRIQHGLVNVLVDNLTQGVVRDLEQQFGENVGSGDNAVAVLSTADAQKIACRNICHSNILCQYWQSFYNDGSSDGLGCWIENPGVDSTGAGTSLGKFVNYPLTAADYTTSDSHGSFAALTGGQFISHNCPIPSFPTRPEATTTTTTTVVVVAATIIANPPEEGSFMYPWGILIGIASLVVAGAVAGFLLCGGEKEKKPTGGKRGAKIKSQPPAPPATPALPPQPIVPLIQHPIMVQQTVAQPLAMTHIAAPMTTF